MFAFTQKVPWVILYGTFVPSTQPIMYFYCCKPHPKGYGGWEVRVLSQPPHLHIVKSQKPI